jgi:hypothetical protein
VLIRHANTAASSGVARLSWSRILQMNSGVNGDLFGRLDEGGRAVAPSSMALS